VPQTLFDRLQYGYAIAPLLLCTVMINFLFVSGHDMQRCVEIVSLSVMALVLIARAGRNGVIEVPKFAGHLLATFLVLGLASAWSAYSLRHSLNEWSNLLLLLIVVIAIGAEVANDVRRIPALLHWGGIACGLYSLKLLIMYAAALASGFQVDIHSLAIGFSNARFLAHTQTALFPLILLLYLQAPRAGAWRKAWFALAAFWWALLFVCEARATVLALVVACMTAFALRRAHARQFMVALAWTALVGAVI
jgi:hypothetical protein